MNISNTQPRVEIKARLEDIVFSDRAAVDEEDSENTCDFFMNDLAYVPPYDSMVGTCLYQEELEPFIEFMTTIARACRDVRSASSLSHERVEDLKNKANALLRVMKSKDD